MGPARIAVCAVLVLASCEKETIPDEPPPPPVEDAGPKECGQGSFRNAAPGFCITPPTPFKALGTTSAGEKRRRHIEVAALGTFELSWGPMSDKNTAARAQRIEKSYTRLGIKPTVRASGGKSFKARVAGFQIASTIIASGDYQVVCHSPLLARNDDAAFGVCDTLIALPDINDLAQAKLDRDAFLANELAMRTPKGMTLEPEWITCEADSDCGEASGCRRDIVLNARFAEAVSTKLRAKCEERAALMGILGTAEVFVCKHGVCQRGGAFANLTGQLGSLGHDYPSVLGHRSTKASIVSARVPRWLDRGLVKSEVRTGISELKLCYAATLYPQPADIRVELAVGRDGKSRATLREVAPELRDCAAEVLGGLEFFNDERPVTLGFVLRLEGAVSR